MGPNSLSAGQARERLAPTTAHAVATVTHLMREAGPGRHLITTVVRPGNAEPVTASVWFDVIGEGAGALWRGAYADAVAVAEVVALGFVLARGSLVLGTTSPTGEETVRGWVVHGRALEPLTAEQIRHAFHKTLDHAPPVTYQTAFPIPSAAPA